VLVLRLLEVEVDRLQAVLADHLLVGGRGGGRGAARLPELGAVVAAGRHRDVTALGADPADDAGDGGVGRDRRRPVPGGAAPAAVGRQDERELERLLAAAVHHLAQVGRAVVERHDIENRAVPVATERRNWYGSA